MRQHLLPRFYLQGFVDPTSLNRPKIEPFTWILSVEEQHWERRSPKNAASRSEYYEILDGEDEPHGAIEKYLGVIESKAAQILRSKLLKKIPLSAEERTYLAFFISTLHARRPEHHAEAEKLMKERSLEKLAQDLADMRDDPARLREFNEAHPDIEPLSTGVLQDILDHFEDYDVEIPRAWSIGFPILTADKSAKLLCAMRWRFHVAPTSSFVTSNDPLKFFHPRIKAVSVFGGFGYSDVQVTCPLHACLTLVASWRGADGEYVESTDSQVTAINLRTLANAAQVFAADQRFQGVQLVDVSS